MFHLHLCENKKHVWLVVIVLSQFKETTTTTAFILTSGEATRIVDLYCTQLRLRPPSTLFS